MPDFVALNDLPCECSCCEYTGKVCDLLPIKDFEERMYPGEIVPAGECPRCRCLAHLAPGTAIVVRAPSQKGETDA